MTTTTMLDTDRALVQAATAVAKRRCRSDNHSVAAAARTADGRVFTGVNLAHFTGGPCAELVALGAAATQGEAELETIVAVGDRGVGRFRRADGAGRCCSTTTRASRSSSGRSTRCGNCR